MLRLAAEFRLASLHVEGTELLDSLVTSVFLLDHELRVGYLNAAAQTLLGLGSNQALGRSITELTRGAETLLPLFDRARSESEGVVQRELAWPAPGGVDRIHGCCWKSKTSRSIGA
jgi:nitrogen-specific signal transduction histidine kinase